jgi:hypothetical protein
MCKHVRFYFIIAQNIYEHALTINYICLPAYCLFLHGQIRLVSQKSSAEKISSCLFRRSPGRHSSSSCFAPEVGQYTATSSSSTSFSLRPLEQRKIHRSSGSDVVRTSKQIYGNNRCPVVRGFELITFRSRELVYARLR